MDLLQAIVARLDGTGVPENKFPDAKGEYWAHCPLPDHATERRPDNFSVSLKGYKCFSCGAKGSLKQLARLLGIEYQPPRRGCTLAEYAKAKRLPPGFLRGLGLQDGDRFGRPALDLPYKDEAGRLIRLRKRIAPHQDTRSRKDNRFRWDKGNAQPLYGLWRLAEIERAGWVLLLEGESDCHTAWLHQIPALGVPGAANWDKAKGNLRPPARPQGLRLARAGPGRGHVHPGHPAICRRRGSSARPRARRTLRGHCRGEDVAALLEELKARAGHRDVRPPGDGETLAGFAP